MHPNFDVLPTRYEIEREVGRGGSARVYVAADTTLGGRVAIKFLDPALASTVAMRRFEREIRVLTNLRHPGILPVLDAGTEGSSLYYVMPYLEGATLEQRLAATGPLAYLEVLSIVHALAAAMDYAHAQNVVHRDIKPANILFSGSQPVIADFGIARAIVAAASELDVSSSGLAIGTPLYMSPEQSLEPSKVDGRADIYSLGCVTFEMLTGRPPFTGATPLAIITRHVAADPPRVGRADVPPHADRALAAALAKSPDARPPTAEGFALALAGEA